MTAADIAAYIGAAAWLPQIFSWLYSYFIRPEIKVVQGRAVEVGFTSYGPIVNMPVALLSERKGALINSMKLMVQHTRGRKYDFFWSGLHEFSSNTVGSLTAAKTAIALNLVSGSLVEKTVGFQDSEFQRKFIDLTAAARTQLAYLKSTNQPAEVQLQSKEFAEVINHFKFSTAWEEGTYSATLQISVLGESKPRSFTYRFDLSNSDMQRLRANNAEIEKYLKDVLVGPPAENANYAWFWAYPELKPPAPEINPPPFT